MLLALALIAAFLFGLASVLQHQAAQEAPPERSMRPGLLVDLVRRPLWLAGQGTAFAGFGFQAAALSIGALAIVQPVLVTRLVFGLVLAARITHHRLGRTEWTGTAATVGGLAAFLLAARPAEGAETIDGSGWVGVLLVTALPAVILVLIAPRHAGVGRAMALAGAGALLFVATVTLTKFIGHELRGDAASVLTSWHLYALAPAGLGAMLMVQSAFMAGPIRASLSVLTCVECLGAIAVGAIFLEESLSIDPVAVAFEAIGLAAVVWGVITLARSPVLVETLEAHPEQQ